jgi:hypothetical protein
MNAKFYERFATELIRNGIIEVHADGSIWKLKKTSNLSGKSRGRYPRRADTSRKSGYPVVCLTVNGRSYSVKAHRIVWQVFFGDIPPDKEINHKDGVRHNSHPDNLELQTRSGNIKHAMECLKSLTHPKGVLHQNHKLDNDKVREILHLRARGKTANAIAKQFNVSEGLIRHVYKGRAWQHITRLK